MFELVLLCRPFSKNVASRDHHYLRHYETVFHKLFNFIGCAVLQVYNVQEVSMEGLSVETAAGDVNRSNFPFEL
jgi:hypothetical protein